ncbi:MAG TPA: 2-C-methyl-D-erythritol 2,4-cyclodiphosphate synthase [Acidimicrobiia bacterium]
MHDVRMGLGFDAHRFGGKPPLLLGGVVVDPDRGVEATSDGDVVAHATCDALLGSLNLGDMGMHFPSSDPRWAGADSMLMLQTVVRMVLASGWWVRNLDITVVAQDLVIGPHRDAISVSLSEVLETEAVSLKATSTDGMGFTGRNEGLAALAVVAVTI